MLVMMLIMAFPVIGLALFLWLPAGAALTVYAPGVVLAAWLHWLMSRTMKLPVRTGRRGLIGATARVVSWEGNSGRVRCHDEIWRARAERGRSLEIGDRAEIAGFDDGLTLIVRPVSGRPVR